MPNVAIPGNTTTPFNFTWSQPAESAVSESVGPDANRVVATIKYRGDPQTRRNAALALLEYPTVGGTGPFYIKRNISLAYPTPIWASPDDANAYLYAEKFLASRGVGGVGEDSESLPLSQYSYCLCDVEFTDRAYDILPDSAVLGPAALSGPPTINAATQTANQGSQYPGGVQYNFQVTAVDSDGSTTPSLVTTITPAAGASVTISWVAVAGAIGYRVYSYLTTTPAGQAWNIATVNAPATSFVSYVPLQSPWPLEALPTVNTTGSPIAGFPDEGAALGAGTGSIGGRYVIRESEEANRAVTIPRGMYGYRGFVNKNQIPEGLLVSQACVSLSWHWMQVPRSAVPHQTITNALGTVNLVPFAGFEAGTLLLDGVTRRYYRSPVGGRLCDLRYAFVLLPNIDHWGHARGHNASLQALGGPLDGGGPLIVDYMDMNSSPLDFQGFPPFRSSLYAKLYRPGS